jgi:hypothetical protein
MTDREAPDLFTMYERNGSTFLMRGKICFGEISQSGNEFSAWGYGLDRIGIFPTWDEAARAVVASTRETLAGAGLAVVGQPAGAVGEQAPVDGEKA